MLEYVCSNKSLWLIYICSIVNNIICHNEYNNTWVLSCNIKSNVRDNKYKLNNKYCQLNIFLVCVL